MSAFWQSHTFYDKVEERAFGPEKENLAFMKRE
jgi:hypothetical protein